MTAKHSKKRSLRVDADREVFRTVIDELFEHFVSTSSITVGHAKAHDLLVLHGLVAHVMYNVEAARFLLDSGRTAAAEPLARVAFEHSVVALWAHVHPDGTDALRSKARLDYKRLIREAAKAVELPDDVVDAYQRIPEPGRIADEVKRFEETCKFFAVPSFYLIYRQLSESVHPGRSTLDRYFEGQVEDISSLKLRNSPRIDSDEHVLYPLALACVLASFVYEDLRKTKPYKPKIRAAAADIGTDPWLIVENARKRQAATQAGQAPSEGTAPWRGRPNPKRKSEPTSTRSR